MGETLKQRIQQDSFESPAQEAMLNLLVASDHLRGKVDLIAGEYGITRGKYNVLRILRGIHPNGHSRAEIIRRLIERAPDVTRLVDRLEQSGLAKRDRSTTDRRLSLTRITRQGLRLLKTMDPKIQGVGNFFAKRLSRTECRQLSRLCEKLYSEPC